MSPREQSQFPSLGHAMVDAGVVDQAGLVRAGASGLPVTSL